MDCGKERDRLKMAGAEALVLSPEDLLLHLCQHTWKHSLTGWRKTVLRYC